MLSIRANWIMDNFERRLEQLFEWFFDHQPTARIFAVNLFIVALANLISDQGNVNRTLILDYGVSPIVVHLYMGMIALASLVILAQRQPPFWLYLPGVSYILLVFVGVLTPAILRPSSATLSAAMRIIALNGLLLALIIKNLRGQL